MAEYIKKEDVLKLLEKNSITKKITLADGISIYDSVKNASTADVVEVETIKAWLYEMAINNVGCDGDFSKACEEIISRLDGLRNFAKERSEG